MQRAVMALLKAETEKACEFSQYMKMLTNRPNVVVYLNGSCFAGKTFQTIRRNVTSFRDGLAFHTRCSGFHLTYAAITLPVNIAFLDFILCMV